MTTLPGPLCLSSAFPFVGRARELTLLRSLVPWADGEGRRVAVVGGEAGSGKSRLIREFAVEAAERGALVLYGACDAVVRPPYGPFVEALEPLDVSAAGPELARMLGGPAAPAAADPDTERHRLHTAVINLLEAIGRGQPVLLVIEDAHWADAPTLGLIRHLARAARRARL
jgi:predicted ATPase